MPESASSNAGGVFGSLPAWMGGKLIAAIVRGNRTTNQAGIAAFRERARVTLNPPKPPPAPTPVVHEGASSPAPGPSSRRASKSKRKKIREPTREEVMQATFESYLRALQGGFSGSARGGGKYSAPPIGSKSAQRGSVGVARSPAKASPSVRSRRTAGPGGRTFTSSRRAGARGTGPGARAAPRAATTAVPLDDPELSPVEVPQRERYTDLSPIEVPARERYTGLEPVEVPNRRKYGSSPAARPGDGAVRPRGSPGTARYPRPASAPRPAALPRTRPGAASLRVGAFELPLEPIIRALTTRKPPPAARPASATQPVRSPIPELVPGTDPFSQPQVAYDYDRKCKCPKKKASKPRTSRTECRSGTYRQTARGVTYRPNKIVPCT